TIENQDAYEIGKLKDFIIASDTGKPLYGVVTSGGFAGLKPQRKLVPTPMLSLASAKRTVLDLEVPSKKWSEPPTFQKSDVPNLGKYETVRQIYAFYGVSFRDLLAAEPSGKPGAARLTQTGQGANATVAADVNVQRASEIIGEAVFDCHREKLGNVSDLLLD